MREHRFRQSTLGDLDECPERGRLTLTNTLPRITTDAAAVGTACHEGFECLIWGETMAVAIVTAEAKFAEIAALPNFEWKKYSPKAVPNMIRNALAAFAKDVLTLGLEPVDTEMGFKDVLLWEDDERRILLEGTIDYFDQRLGAWDWKTTSDGRKYQQGFGGESWKLDRWNIQSTVYTKALVALGLLDPEGPWDFTFGGFVLPGGAFTPHTVTRTVGDHDWLAQKCLAWARLIEADVPQWPLTDNHALCSDKWCPAWSECKGKSVGVPWPRRADTQF